MKASMIVDGAELYHCGKTATVPTARRCIPVELTEQVWREVDPELTEHVEPTLDELQATFCEAGGGIEIDFRKAGYVKCDEQGTADREGEFVRALNDEELHCIEVEFYWRAKPVDAREDLRDHVIGQALRLAEMLIEGASRLGREGAVDDEDADGR